MKNRNEKRVMNPQELLTGAEFIVNDYGFGNDHYLAVGTVVTVQKAIVTQAHVKPVNCSKPNRKQFWTELHMYQLDRIDNDSKAREA